jgi:glutaconyl-CoA/methylmalonyl-CoA decarboxylase subunit gamma
MQYEVEIGDRLRSITVVRSGEGLAVEIDGRTWHVDAARIDPHRMSLLVAGAAPGRHARLILSREVVFSSDPAASQQIVHVGTKPFAVTVNARRRRQDVPAGRVRGGAPGDRGPQRILAPMPGKVVRVLVRAGDVVGARQPLVVVEAMKMENELRAGRDGRVAAIHVQEGMSVDSGALMVVIE